MSIWPQTIFVEAKIKHMSLNDWSCQVVFSEMSEVTVTNNTYASMHDVISMSIKSDASICWLAGSKIRFTNLEQSTVAEIAFSPTGAMTKKENARNEHGGWNKWRSEREKCLAYSRYLCVTARSSDVMEKRPSTSSSDSAFTLPLTHAGCEPYDCFRRRNLTLHKQVNIQDKGPREVYNKDMKFHKKFGTMPTMLKTHTLAPTPNQARSKTCTTNSNSICLSTDDDASSFCDSVSSIACSSISHVDKQEKWANDSSELSDKITKFNAIEKWLQGLPKPVFKTGAGNLWVFKPRSKCNALPVELMTLNV